MATSTDSPAGEPIATDYLGFVRRRGALVVVMLLVFLGLAYGASLVLHKTYKSTAVVEVLPVGPGANTTTTSRTGTSNSTVNLVTESQVVKSTVVGAAAQKLLHTTTPVNTLLGRVSVSVPTNSSVLDISYTARHTTTAQQGAQAFANAYLATRAADARLQIAQQVRTINGDIAGLNGQLRALTNTIAHLPPGSPAAPFDHNRRSMLVTEINGLSRQLGPLASSPVTAGIIVSAAQLPSSAASPKLLYVLAGGAVAGLIIGLFLGAWLEARDHRLRGAREVERRGGVPVLSEVPLARGFASLLDWRSSAGRALSEVGNVVSAALRGEPGTVLVVPVTPGATGGAVAAGLALAFARSDGTALLACAGPAESPAPDMLEIAHSPGLREALRAGDEAAPVAQTTPRRAGLRVVAPGVVLDEEELARPRPVLESIERTRSGEPVVVVETPGVEASPLAQGLAHGAEVVLLVVNDLRSRREELARTVREFDQVGAHPLGVVLVSGRAPRSAGTGRRSAAGAPGNVRPVPAAPAPLELAAAGEATVGAPTAERSEAETRVLEPVGAVDPLTGDGTADASDPTGSHSTGSRNGAANGTLTAGSAPGQVAVRTAGTRNVLPGWIRSGRGKPGS